MAKSDPHSEKYLNRELSWLEFNQRVLGEAQDATLPLLERLKFLAITASNQDEFFKVRVGGLTLLSARDAARRDPAGMTPSAQLAAISERVHQMVHDQYECYLNELESQMAEEGIRFEEPDQLSERQENVMKQVFEDELYPVFSPMLVNPEESFPQLSDMTLCLVVRFVPARPIPNDDNEQYAILPFGEQASRFITLPSEQGYSCIRLEQALAFHIDQFFPGSTILECKPFRITRNADLAVDDEFSMDFMLDMEELIQARRRGDCIRLEICNTASDQVVNYFRENLNLDSSLIYRIPGPLDLSSFMSLTGLNGFDHLQYEPWRPTHSTQVDRTVTMFENMARQNIMLVHPYESFEPVVRFLEEAADDPDVLAIKQTLYRTSRNSPIISALTRAARNGKYVTVVVELKARFDEARNIIRARDMEDAGVQVIYGVKGLKTHSKICVVVRRESYGIQRYVHFGTGNYNESTAKIYSDVSYMTCDEELGADATSFFNAITGYSLPREFHELDMAPIGLRARLLEMIETEIERKKQGQKALIIAKMNSLVDPAIIDALYRASQVGVVVKLNIRGICCLRPGIKGLSETISVVSIIDRFLEHARVFYFFHGGDRRVFISSADWMPRNLDRRVELLVPIRDPKNRDRLVELLECYFKDNVKAHELQGNGRSHRLAPTARRPAVRSQEFLHEYYVDRALRETQKHRTTFEPHVPPEHDSV